MNKKPWLKLKAGVEGNKARGLTNGKAQGVARVWSNPWVPVKMDT
jgi:hypothetical protein